MPPSVVVASCRDDDDALTLASIVAAGAPAGTVLDVGSGAGGVAIPLLRARPDIDVLGLEISPARGDESRRLADRARVGDRFAIRVGHAFGAPLPVVRTIVANPPMLPGEPGFSVPARRRQRDLFWIRLLAEADRLSGPLTIWLHLFDFHGVGRSYGPWPAVEDVATGYGFAVDYEHRDLRAAASCGPIAKGIGPLRAIFPEAAVVADGEWVRLADLEWSPNRLFVPHSVVRLSRS